MDTALPKNLSLVRALHRAVFPLNTVNFGVDVASHRTGDSRSSLAANTHAGTANHPVFLIVKGQAAGFFLGCPSFLLRILLVLPLPFLLLLAFSGAFRIVLMRTIVKSAS